MATHQERQAARAASKAAVNAAYSTLVAKLEAQRGQADDRKAVQLAEIEVSHAAEQRAAFAAFARKATETLDPLMQSFTADPSRANGLTIASAWQKLNVDAQTEIGRALDREIGHSFGAALIARSSGAISALAQLVVWDAAFEGCLEAIALVNRTMPTSDPALCHDALLQLERAVARSAVLAGTVANKPQERWDAIRFAGSRTLAAEAIAVLDRELDAARSAKALGTPRQRNILDALLGRAESDSD